ncbi:NEAT domain-containing protein [Companilactobacillus sp.]|jgi:LPXTG-motif cell wall-anchored protein|uniref:NEAT domain-containing protein n=1 Tax=Companilactobacillus sp. TaxID=2767905 RepID=UPI0025BCF6F9|nr:NEAT domain-containing protein [Companilactobacillus sp.]MCH4009590.1 NEAT domain-containing protein [Companilactobacillus sp.]MCH4052734.1 NEAT domain-containing protein [Companilactobacillus sp.]MCH4077532.1 NEAT domain-containing protein [Companilactobacillus sp.]MCH4126108.1 NEAT domain-containing protein [Companilactobacillus sp.]MCI1311816.1 NEAT domain-containing protein [Companilactobacillus sp.]
MKKSIVKILAVGMLLGGAIVPATVANVGLPQVTTTQTAKAATNDQAQTISYKVLKTGTSESSLSAKYFTNTAKVTPNGDGTYKVTLQVEIPSIASVDIQTMNGNPVSDSDTYSEGGKSYKDISFNVNKLSDLDNKMNSQMSIKVLGLGLMNPTADFVFDTSSLKDQPADKDSVKTDPAKDTKTDDETPLLPDAAKDPTGTIAGSDNLLGTADSNNSGTEGTNVVIGTPVTTSGSTTATEQDIPYQVLKADASQGESVSTQFFTGTAKVTPNDDGTYKVSMTMVYPTSFGTEPVTIDSINGGSITSKNTYSQGDQNYMDFTFNVNSLSDLNQLVPCTMTIDVSNLGFNSTESVNFKFNATSSGVAGTSAVTTPSTSGTGVYGSTSGWPTSGSTSTPSSSTGNTTLPQTGNTTNSIILTIMGVAVASMTVVLFKKTSGFRA